MRKYLSSRSLNFLLGIILLGAVVALWIQGNIEPAPKPDEFIEAYYTFDPESILTLVAQDDPDAFEMQSDGFEPVLTVPEVTVEWSQTDYLQIAGALHEKITNESITDKRLHFLNFGAECKKVEEGPQQAVFELYEIEHSFFKRNGNRVTINIDPITGSIWFQTERIPSSEIKGYLSSIDLSNLTILASNAFQIAEMNGGRDARLEIQNDCLVSAILAPDGAAPDWKIRYFNRESSHIFEITINEHSGEYEIVNQ